MKGYMTDLAPEDQKMIFVVGNSRSGTTMLSQVLGRNAHVATLLESHFLEELWSPERLDTPLTAPTATRLLAQLLARQADPYARFAGVEAARPFEAAAEALLATIPAPWLPLRLWAACLQQCARSQGKLIPLEQTPRNVFYLEAILARLPEARVVVMIRDARDVILSQKFKWQRFAGQSDAPRRLAWLFWANYHPINMSLLWMRAIRAGDRFQDHPRVRCVRFEDVLADSVGVVEDLCRWLGLTFESQMLHIPTNSSYAPGQLEAVGIQPAAAGRWQRDRRNRADLAVCQQLTRPLLAQHGYGLSAALQPRWYDWAWAGTTWPVKVGLTLALNFGRIRPFLSILPRRLYRWGRHLCDGQASNPSPPLDRSLRL